jgi:hypothetical protein
MSISTGLDWVGNLGPNAEKAAGSVDKLAQSLRALQSIQGSGVAALGSGGIGGAGVGAAAKEANKAVLIQTKSAADLAKIEATRLAQLDAINAKQSASNAAITGRESIVKQQGANAQGIEAARSASNIASIQAKSDADRNRSIGRIVENQSKAADSAYLLQVKGAEASTRATEKNALIEKQGAIKAAQLREKYAADAHKIQVKGAVDMARDAQKAALKQSSSKVGVASAAGTKGGDAGDVHSGRAARVAAVGSFALDAGRAAFDAAKQVAALSYQFGSAVVGAQAFKEDISEAFKTVRGSTAAADKTFQTAIASADKLGITRAESIGQFLDLATKGFDDAKIREIQGRLLDIATIDPRASQEGLTKVIGKIQATGRLNQETLNELSTFGLEQGDVIKQIGKALGKGDAAVLKQLSTSGGLRDSRNVDFVLAAIAGQTGGGKAGEKAAEKADRNLSSLIKRASEVPQNILFDLEVGPGLDGIKGILRSVLDFFAAGSETAANASRVIGGAFNAIVSGLTGKDISKDSSGITDVLGDIVSLIEMATPALGAMASAARITFTGIAFVVGGLGEIVKFFSGDFSSVETAFNVIGTSIIDGLVNGITAGAVRVVDAVSSVASSALSTAKSVLGIASPSKETAALGEWYSIGMGDGIESKADYVTRAARVTAEDALLAASMPMPRLGMGASQTGVNGVAKTSARSPNVTINVNVANAGNDVSLGHEELKDKYRPVFRELAIEMFLQIAAEPVGA